MKIRVLGAGWYGCHIAAAMIEAGHEVEVVDPAGSIFAGASGSIPARVHLGFHYPRSRMTRAACQEHSEAFLARYGRLTRGVPVNIYAIAEAHSLVDFDQYLATLRGEVELIRVHDPAELGLFNVEGAVLTGERHIVPRLAREHFQAVLGDRVRLGTRATDLRDPAWDWTIDCTFGASSSAGVDRYEPCLVLILAGPTDRAITIMDGPFGSLYPWDEDRGLCSLSSARWTPFDKTLRTYREAQNCLAALTQPQIEDQARGMLDQMRGFYPAISRYEVVDYLTSIRAMPLSGADTRLVDVAPAGERAVRVRAGKIDAVIAAEVEIKRMIGA